jgi:hypothetical protein
MRKETQNKTGSWIALILVGILLLAAGCVKEPVSPAESQPQQSATARDSTSSPQAQAESSTIKTKATLRFGRYVVFDDKSGSVSNARISPLKEQDILTLIDILRLSGGELAFSLINEASDRPLLRLRIVAPPTAPVRLEVGNPFEQAEEEAKYQEKMEAHQKRLRLWQADAGKGVSEFFSANGTVILRRETLGFLEAITGVISLVIVILSAIYQGIGPLLRSLTVGSSVCCTRVFRRCGEMRPHKPATKVVIVIVVTGTLFVVPPYIFRWLHISGVQNGPVRPVSAKSVEGRLAMTTTDINIRLGPNAHYEQIGLAEYSSRLRVFSCNVDETWCEIEVLEHGRSKKDQNSADRGWVNRRYLMTN